MHWTALDCTDNKHNQQAGRPVLYSNHGHLQTVGKIFEKENNLLIKMFHDNFTIGLSEKQTMNQIFSNAGIFRKFDLLIEGYLMVL